MWNAEGREQDEPAGGVLHQPHLAPGIPSQRSTLPDYIKDKHFLFNAQNFNLQLFWKIHLSQHIKSVTITWLFSSSRYFSWFILNAPVTKPFHPTYSSMLDFLHWKAICPGLWEKVSESNAFIFNQVFIRSNLFSFSLPSGLSHWFYHGNYRMLFPPIEISIIQQLLFIS